MLYRSFVIVEDGLELLGFTLGDEKSEVAFNLFLYILFLVDMNLSSLYSPDGRISDDRQG